MNTFSQNRQVKLIKPQNEFYKQINQDINTTTTFIKPKYLRLTEEYYEKLGGLSTERQTETKVHFDEYYYQGETYNSEEYERYTNGEDSPSYMMYLNAKSFKGK
jgi:DNA-binding protein H-NS